MLSSSVKLKDSCDIDQICINGECRDNECVDEDNDGYDTCGVFDPGDDGKPVDCNDDNDKVYPGAPELCDGLDNDCDGLIDELNGDCRDPLVCTNGVCVRECVEEGGTIPVIPNAPECCDGLTKILPKSPDIIGISGICTNKCGNNVCDVLTETNYNCASDCEITCTQNSDCGEDSLIGDKFCKNENVFQEFVTYTCNNPGTISSSCSDSKEDRLQDDCSDVQKCDNGECKNIEICDDGIDNDGDGLIDGLVEKDLCSNEDGTIRLNEVRIREIGETFADLDDESSLRNDITTGNKVCELAGYSNWIKSRQNSYTTCYNNNVIYWNGISFVKVSSCGYNNRKLISLTCDLGCQDPPQCSNSIDDDNDGLIDMADPGCESPNDDNERSHDPDCD
ncbi:hypothetical protein GOV12_00595 [Candidatus Pacearchaeota archaeon]|nr:hypothetical protein [Candidatus Pacearchaeota archaeon]